MQLRATSGLLAILIAFPASTFGESIDRVLVGANYLLKGVFSESEVRVASVDPSRKRVQVVYTDTNRVEWVSAENLITPSESTDRNIARGVFAVAAAAAILDSFNSSTDKSKPKKIPSTAGTPPSERKAPSTPVYSREQLAEKAVDASRTSPYPVAAGSFGRTLFKRDEFDIYVNRAKPRAWIFHGKKIDYNEISHLEYHYYHNWVAVVGIDGSRRDLGANINWVIRPYWRKCGSVEIVRTKDGETQEGRRFDIKTVYGAESAKVFRAGIVGSGTAGTDQKPEGIVVSHVGAGSAAAKAGLRKDDVLVKIDGRRITEIELFKRTIEASGGSPITVIYERAGSTRVSKLVPELVGQ